MQCIHLYHVTGLGNADLGYRCNYDGHLASCDCIGREHQCAHVELERLDYTYNSHIEMVVTETDTGNARLLQHPTMRRKKVYPYTMSERAWHRALGLVPRRH